MVQWLKFIFKYMHENLNSNHQNLPKQKNIYNHNTPTTRWKAGVRGRARERGRGKWLEENMREQQDGRDGGKGRERARKELS